MSWFLVQKHTILKKVEKKNTAKHIFPATKINKNIFFHLQTYFSKRLKP